MSRLLSGLTLILGILWIGPAWGTSYSIPTFREYIDPITQWDLENLAPGDTILLEPGVRGPLIIQNVQGSKEQPIIITNHEGDVIIDANHYFGVSIRRFEFIEFSGSGGTSEYG